jgi:hypothetical protein
MIEVNEGIDENELLNKHFKNIKKNIPQITVDSDVDDSELLLLLKEKVKLIEKKIKESNKPKTITISGRTHNEIKKFCTTLNFSIGEWCEKVLLKEIKYNNCVIVDEEDYDEKDVISKKWIEEAERKKYLIKYNKHILSNEFKFIGYSIVDGYLVYEYIGKDMTFTMLNNNFDELGIKIGVVEDKELVRLPTSKVDFDEYLILKNIEE